MSRMGGYQPSFEAAYNGMEPLFFCAMQIVTLSDAEFPKLLAAWRDGKLVGRYWREDNAVQIVYATPMYLIVGLGENPEKLAVKPALNLNQAEALGRRLITREMNRGSRVEFECEQPSAT